MLKELQESYLENTKRTIANAQGNLYFWQLGSLVSESDIHSLIQDFYERVFTETPDWFREPFLETGTLDHHVSQQTKFWCALFGKEVNYKGGEKKVFVKHNIQKHIMTNEGRNIWMFHMKRAIQQNRTYFEHDERIIPCMLDFLTFFMNRYANEFGFSKL